MAAAACAATGLACSSLRDPGEGTGEQIGEHRAALEVGPEQEIDLPDPVPVPTDQGLDALMFDPQSNTFVAMWGDFRESFPAIVNDNPWDFGARISSDGALLDPSGIPVMRWPITEGSFTSRYLTDGICSDTGVCLLVGTTFVQGQVVAVRVAGGEVIDTTPLVVGSGSGFPTVAWDGTAFRVTWNEFGPAMYMSSVTLEGQVGPAVQVAGNFRSGGRATCEGARCLLIYARSDVTPLAWRARLVDLSGPIGDEFELQGRPTRPGDEHCWDGTRYWVPFVDNVVGFGVTRVSADGTVLDPDGIQVAPVDEESAGDREVSMGCGSDHVVVTWTIPAQAPAAGSHRAFVARVARDGTVLDPGGVEIAATQPVTAEPSGAGPIACGSGQCLLAWRNGSRYAQSVRATRLVGTTQLDPEGIDIITAPPAQTAAVATHADGRYLALWTDGRASSVDPRVRPLRGSLFTSSFDQLAAVEIGPAPIVKPERDCLSFGLADYEPAVAASATSFLATWRENCYAPLVSNVFAQVIDREGRAVAPSFMVAGTTASEMHPAAASNGDEFLLVWDRTTAGDDGFSSVHARRLDAAGAPLGPESFPVAPLGAKPVAAFDGTNYVTVWQREKSPEDGAQDLYAARVSPDGVVLDPEGIALATHVKREEAQSIACGGGVCLIVWRRGRTVTNSGVRALRLAADGSVLDPEGFEVSPVDRPMATSVTFAGGSFLVAWRDGDGEIRGAEVSLDGTVLGPSFVISPPGEATDNPSLVSNGVDHALALYDRFDLSSQFQIRRVRARTIAQLATWPDAGPSPEPDAGPGTDGVPGDDAAASPPPNEGDDGDDGQGDGGDSGGCRTSHDGGASPAATCILLLGAWLLLARRRAHSVKDSSRRRS